MNPRFSIKERSSMNQVKPVGSVDLDYLRSLFDHGDDLMFVIDGNKRIILWNASLELLSGCSWDEVKMKRLDTLDLFENTDEIVSVVEQVCNLGVVEKMSIVLRTRHGDSDIVEGSFHPVVSKVDGSKASVLCIARNRLLGRDDFKDLWTGKGVLLMDVGEKEALSFLRSVATGRKCLVITRSNPGFVERMMYPCSVRTVLLRKDTGGSGCVYCPDEIVERIEWFCREHENSMVLLSRMDYVLTMHSFDRVLKMVYGVNDVVHRWSSLFLLHVSDSSFLSEQQIRLLHSEFAVLMGKSFWDSISNRQAYDIFRCILDEKKIDKDISFKQLRKKLMLSYPTIRKYVRYLEENGFVRIVKKGRRNIVLINESRAKIY